MSALKQLIESGEHKVIVLDGLRVESFGNGVVNVMDNAKTDLTQPQLDVFRKRLTEAGYREQESWVATQGASWLTSGMFAGVSIRTAKI